MYSRVYVEITNACNLSCSFCHGHARPLSFMSEEQFLRVLGQLEGKTKYVYYHLMGEPLLHPALPRFVSLARERGFHSVVTTNGTLLEERGGELLSAGVYKVNISVHSLEDAAPLARERYLDAVIDFAERAATRGVIVVLRLWNRGYDDALNACVFDTLKARVRGEWTPNTRGVRIRDKLHIEWGERFTWPDKDAPVVGECVYCYGLADHFGILCDGTVVPCCMDSDGIMDLGNVFAVPLDEILDSPRARAIREGFAKKCAVEELCRRCAYSQRFL